MNLILNPLVTKLIAGQVKYHSNLKILIAEDNEINRVFFIKLLKIKGFSCDVAINGKKAVEACVKKEYDIVFMDCQMPVMDGYEATREIRKAEGNTLCTPIIAMTANAMKGDRERCLAAGMDEYLSKPVDVEQVFVLLDKYSKKKGTVGEIFIIDN